MNAQTLSLAELYAEAEAKYCTDPAKPFPGEQTERAPITEDDPWFAVRVTPMQEGYVKGVLDDKGVVSYFPLRISFPLHAKRKATRERPLIPGYLFVCIPHEHALDLVRAVRGFREVMCYDGRPRRVPPIHLGSLILMEACHEYDESWVPPKPKGKRYHHRWDKGDVVRIEDRGAFHGFSGRVLRTNRKSRITLEVMLFGQSSEIEVKTKHLRAL